MRTLIRRDKTMPAHHQMMARTMDALASQTHPNGIANTERQREESRRLREAHAAVKEHYRLARTARRMEKKAARLAARTD